jgi:hypothetical protein
LLILIDLIDFSAILLTYWWAERIALPHLPSVAR